MYVIMYDIMYDLMLCVRTYMFYMLRTYLMILCNLVTEDVDHKFFVNLEFWFVVGDEIGHFICEDYNI